jgi:LPXTG-site transpeptidase (sortase) family protein
VKRKWIALGITGPLLLAGCVCLFLAGLTGWWLLKPEQQAKIIRIAPLAPLTTPLANLATEVAQPPAAEQPAAPAVPPPAEAVATATVEAAPNYTLPPGSVNSLTQEGVGTRLVIPRLNLDAPIIFAPLNGQSWQVDHLGQAVGHLEGTAAPGSDSNLVLAGHVTLSASVYGPFAGLGQLTAGDEVIVYEGATPYKYIVDDYHVVDRTAVDVTYPTSTGQITLITCNTWNSEEGRYLQRLIVKGHLVKN